MKKILSKLTVVFLILMLLTPILVIGGAAASDTVATASTSSGPLITMETINTLLQAIVTGVFIPVLLYLTSAAFGWLKEKTHSSQVNKYLSIAKNAVDTAVAEVMQTFVSSLKNSGKWTPQTATAAFNMAKGKAISIIGSDIMDALPAIVGDVNTWITSQIEASTLYLKTSLPPSKPDTVVSGITPNTGDACSNPAPAAAEPEETEEPADAAAPAPAPESVTV